MEEKTEGIIMRLHSFGDTSLILKWITVDSGRISTLAKGARGPKSSFRGQLDILFKANISLHRKSKSNLHLLKEARLTDPHAGLRSRLDSLEGAAFAIRLIETATEEETPVPEIYQLFGRYLHDSSTRPDCPFHLHAFVLHFLNELGVMPSSDTESLPASEKDFLTALRRYDYSTRAEANQWAEQTRRRVEGYLIHLFCLHTQSNRRWSFPRAL